MESFHPLTGLGLRSTALRSRT